MPKVLYLLRHAQSAEKQAGQGDIDRELTAFGKQQAMLIGKFLAESKKNPEIMLCSTANRAKSTAMHVAAAIQKKEMEVQLLEELYELSIDSFHRIIQSLDDSFSSAMIIGHNPILSYLVSYLAKEDFSGMSTGALSVVTFQTDHWAEIKEGMGQLESYVEPGQIKSN